MLPNKTGEKKYYLMRPSCRAEKELEKEYYLINPSFSIKKEHYLIKPGHNL